MSFMSCHVCACLLSLSLSLFPLSLYSFFARHIYLPLPRCRYCCGSVAVAVVAFVSSTNKISAINIRLPMRQRVNMYSYECVCGVVCALLASFLHCFLRSVCPLAVSASICLHIRKSSPLHNFFQFLMEFIFIANTTISDEHRHPVQFELSLSCNLFRQVTLGCLF